MDFRLRFLLFLLYALFITKQARTQYVINYDGSEELIHAGKKGVEVVEDKNYNITIDDLLKHRITFTPSEAVDLNFKNNSSRFWVHFILNNSTHEKLIIQFNNPEIDYIHVYCVKNNTIITDKYAGFIQPFENRFFKSNKISLPLSSDSCDVYIAMNTISSFWCPLSIGTPAATADANHLDDLFNGAYMGIMVVMLLYNLLVFFFILDRVYLRYCVYLLFSLIMMIVIKGFHIDLVWRTHPTWNGFQNYFVALTAITAIWFSVAFLKLNQTAPKTIPILKILVAGLVAASVLELINIKTLANNLTQSLGGITSIVLFILGLICYSRGLKEAKYYIIAWSLLLTGAVMFLLMINGVLPVNHITQNSFQIGSGLEAVLLSFALADRINTFIRERLEAQAKATAQALENERLISEQNIFLETKVHERTIELEEKVSLIDLQKTQIAKEKERAEDLLLNILPAEVAKDLQNNGKYTPKRFENATVLFADIVNFTPIGQEMSPEDLVTELDYLFINFDEIISKYKIEKIKTIGDAYLCVGGLPVPTLDNPLQVVTAAMEIREFMKEYKEERLAKGKLYFEVRIGIHSGNLVAGIVGIKKFAYDVWGDTVNTAARMEQTGDTNKINISRSTYDFIKDKIPCTSRGFIEIKGKDKMELFFVD